MLDENHAYLCMGNMFCAEYNIKHNIPFEIPDNISYPYIERCVLDREVSTTRDKDSKNLPDTHAYWQNKMQPLDSHFSFS